MLKNNFVRMIRMSVTLGTPLQSSAFKVLLLGSGELGKEVVISLQRLGVKYMQPTVMITHQQCKLHIFLMC